VRGLAELPAYRLLYGDGPGEVARLYPGLTTRLPRHHYFGGQSVNRAIASEIAGCLRVSGSPVDHVRNLAAFSRGDWKHAQEWLDQSGIALWFWDRLKGLGARDAVPPEIGERLDRLITDHSLRVESMAEEFDSINRTFELAGVEYAVLKGFALIPEYARDARLRTAYDFDYLLPPDSMERVDQPLRNGGYIHRHEDAGHSLRYTRSASTPRPFPQRDYLYSAALPRAVELHSRLWEPEPLMVPLPLPEDFLARKRLRNWHGLSFYSLAEEDELMFQVLHAFRHILTNWCRLCVFFEIAQFLERRGSDSVFWQRFLERIRNVPLLSEMVGVVFSLAAHLFGAPVPKTVDTEIMRNLRHPLVLWVRHYGCDSALANLANNKYGLFLHREFVPDAASWRKIRRRRLLPLQRPNRGAQSSSPRVSDRLATGWRQASYIGQRLLHHSVAAVRFLWESRRWERMRRVSRTVG